MGILGPPLNQLCDLQQINCLFWASIHSSAKCGQLCLSHSVSGEQNEIKARWSAKPSGRAWKDSTRALSLVPLPTPSHFSCPWGVRRVLHAKAGLSSIFRCFTKREAVLQGGTSMDLGYRTVSVCAKSLQSCLTLCNRMDYSPPGSSAHGILQARTPEWVAISLSCDYHTENQ